MPSPGRIRASEVRRRLETGDDLLLVCAYPDDEKFRQMPIEGAISFREFQARRPRLAHDADIVFY